MKRPADKFAGKRGYSTLKSQTDIEFAVILMETFFPASAQARGASAAAPAQPNDFFVVVTLRHAGVHHADDEAIHPSLGRRARRPDPRSSRR